MFYFRRSLTDRVGLVGAIVYAVRETTREERRDPVPAIGGFPVGWRPTEFPGQVLYDRSCTEQIFTCEVPRSQFKYYTQLSEVEAFALYPDLAKAG